MKRRPLARADRAARLERLAERRARDLLRAAQREADDCRRRAEAQGHAAGFERVALQWLDYLQRVRQHEDALRERVADAVRQVLTQQFGDPALLLRIADALLDRRAQYAAARPSVLLPRGAQRVAATLRARFAEAGVSAEVTCVEASTFVVIWGDEILEFDPAGVAQTVTDAALRGANASLRQVAADALRRMVDE